MLCVSGKSLSFIMVSLVIRTSLGPCHRVPRSMGPVSRIRFRSDNFELKWAHSTIDFSLRNVIATQCSFSIVRKAVTRKKDRVVMWVFVFEVWDSDVISVSSMVFPRSANAVATAKCRIEFKGEGHVSSWRSLSSKMTFWSYRFYIIIV